jgi:hypothetical protein
MTRKWTLAVTGLAAVVLFASWAVLPRLRRASPAPSASASSRPTRGYRERIPFDVAEVVLDGKLGKGWEDWGWGQHDLPESGGMRVELGAYGGVILHHDEISASYGALVFRYRASKPYDDLVRVALKPVQGDDKAIPHVDVDARHAAMLEDGWYEVMVPWAALNPSALPFDRIVIQSRLFLANEQVELDKIVLTKPTPAAAGTATSVRKVSLAVHCDAPPTRISPLIYGIAGNVWATYATARRMGGNPMTRLNWDLGVWNTGNDWYFENVKAERPSVWFEEDLSHGVKGALVVPTIGWVAKDATSVGFPASKFGEQKAHDPGRPEAGNGQKKDGKPIAPGPPAQTSVAAPPELIRKWIQSIRESDRARGVRSVDMYILDNEPNLWNSTHRDVHPDPLSYDELLDRTERYAKAIRDADPEAVIAGPAEWGWTGYFYSAKDQEHGSLLHLDRRAHGDQPLLAYYLRKLREYEKEHGVTLLDVVDVHFYPQVSGIYGDSARTDAEGSAVRLRSTRALWDPDYKDESWIGEPVRLIPRLKEWISENYPGRGISIGEWSFGAEQRMSGGLAVAEVLGRFGQQGITSAFYWLCPAPGTPAFYAFRAYRNFDGKGGAFLDWSVPTTEASGVSVFASRDEGRTHFVTVLLNLQPETAADAEIDLSTCGDAFSRRSLEYRDGTAGFVAAEAPAGPARGGEKRKPGVLHERIEPYSIKVLDLTILKPPAQ